MSLTQLSTIRLVSKAFAQLIKPLLFRYFIIRPLVSQDSQLDGDLPLARKAIQRLKFYASPEISPLVALIRVYPCAEGTRGRNGDKIIANSFFSLLPQFTRLQTLCCDYIPFNSYALRQLCQLEHLVTLTLRDSPIIAALNDIPFGRLRVASLDFQASYGLIDSYVLWTGLPDATSIKSLSLSVNNAGMAEAFMLSASLKRLPLTRITMPQRSNSLLSILTNCSQESLGHLKALSLQVDYMPPALLKAIGSRCVGIESLTLLIRNRPLESTRDPFTLNVSLN